LTSRADITGMPLPEYVTQIKPGQWRVNVWVQPGAKQDGVVGPIDGRLKLRLKAPAVDGKANKALSAFVAGLLSIKPRQVTLKSGQANRQKTLIVESDKEPSWSRLERDGANH